MFDLKDILACPCCKEKFSNNYYCEKCEKNFEIKEGIPVLICEK
jgi:uncharacterized protein YbaR (Trm112 family)